MNKYSVIALACAVMAGNVTAQDKPDLKDTKQRLSYSIGVNIGTGMKREGLDVDVKALAAGMTDALAGKPALTEAEMREAMTKFQTEMMAKQKVEAEKNIKAGEDFLAANAKKEGVKVLKSGLQYKVIKSGTGKTPKLTDKVKVHYHGTFIDGTVFDSSVKRGEPASFGVNGVIAGWTEVLQLMKEGDKWQVYIPSELAYGEQGRGGIPGNSTLIFDIELLSVEPSNP